MAKFVEQGSGIVQTQKRGFSQFALGKIVVVDHNGANFLRQVHGVAISAHPCTRTFAAARKIVT